MIKKIIGFLVGLILFFVSVQSAFALQTYVGIKILNLTDDPTASCVGEFGTDVDPHQQGRIRALSSILPDYPIYFEFKDDVGTLITSGNIADGDYGMNETIYLPEIYDLIPGANYTLFFDIDAIRIYLPLNNFGGFVRTADNNYWTIGILGGGSNADEIPIDSSNGGCANIDNWGYADANRLLFVSNNRTKLIHSCMTDATPYNCDEEGFAGLWHGGTLYITNTYDFRMNGKYNNLYQPDVGNFQFAFTFN